MIKPTMHTSQFIKLMLVTSCCAQITQKEEAPSEAVHKLATTNIKPTESQRIYTSGKDLERRRTIIWNVRAHLPVGNNNLLWKYIKTLIIRNGHAHFSVEIHKLERKNIRTPAICGELVRRKKIKTAANFLTVGNSLDKSCPLKKIQRV